MTARLAPAAIEALAPETPNYVGLQALSATCPHAGCYVDFVPEQEHFLCPCHNSLFLKTGALKDKDSPSPRPLDSLEVQVRNKNEVWVRYQDFQLGITEKKPVA